MAILSAAGVTACGAVLGITELGTDAVDGGSRIEGGAGDGSGVGDVTGGAWCEANAKGASFCEDFGGSSLSAQWTIEASGRGGEGTLDPDVFTSPPAAFTATVLPPSDVGYAQWCLRRTFAGTYGTVRVAFDVRIDTLEANPSANVTFAELVVTSSGPERQYALKLALRADGVHLLEELSTGSGADHLLRPRP